MIQVSILTSSHTLDDDRLYHHFAKTLAKAGCQVNYTSTWSTGQSQEGSVYCKGQVLSSLKQKWNFFRSEVRLQNPQYIISAEPLTTVFACFIQPKAKLIFDVTEWYPRPVWTGIKALILWIPQLILYLLALVVANKVMFGEESKARPVWWLVGHKSKLISYYPNLDDFTVSELPSVYSPLTLGYAGPLTKSRGVLFLKSLLKTLAELTTEPIVIKLVGAEITSLEWDFGPHIHVQAIPFCTYTQYLQEIQSFHFALDLRECNWEHHHGLPIKIFHYLYVGAIPIYSNLKALHYEFKEENVGLFISPDATTAIAEFILNLWHTPLAYQKMQVENRKRILEEKNWRTLAPHFTTFVLTV